VNAIEFHKHFPDDVTIYKYIANAKWASEDFTCRRCGYDKYCKGKKL
jgi:MoaA/NifB/PqqE/SkfB family radical SAM enzyme